MDNSENTQEFTAQENKAISTASWLVSFYILFQGIYLVMNNCVDKIGGHLLYIFSGLAIILIAIVVMYLVLFLKKLLKIKKYRTRYSAIAILLVLMGACFTYLSYDYAADIFVGTEVVTTDEYIVPRVENTYISFVDNSGENINVFITDEIMNELDKNPIIQNEPWSENYLLYHEDTVTIEYYPNSHVISRVEIDS